MRVAKGISTFFVSLAIVVAFAVSSVMAIPTAWAADEVYGPPAPNAGVASISEADFASCASPIDALKMYSELRGDNVSPFADMNLAGDATFSYTAHMSSGVEYSVVETVTFGEDGRCLLSVMDMTFPDEGAASKFVDSIVRDYGTKASIQFREGPHAVIAIDMSGLCLNRSEYEDALRYSVDDLAVLSDSTVTGVQLVMKPGVVGKGSSVELLARVYDVEGPVEVEWTLVGTYAEGTKIAPLSSSIGNESRADLQCGINETAKAIVVKAQVVGVPEFVTQESIDVEEHICIMEPDPSATVAPTCTTPGKYAFVCKGCGKRSENEVPALGHDLKDEVVKPATCTEKGSMARKCTRCEYVEKTSDIAAKGHAWQKPEWIWSEDWKSATASFVCSNDPSHVESVDGKVTDSKQGDATNHSASATHDGRTFDDAVMVFKNGNGEIVLKGDAVALGLAISYRGLPEDADVTIIAQSVGAKELYSSIADALDIEDADGFVAAYSLEMLVDGVPKHKDFGSLDVAFPIDASHNGKAARVHHVHQGDIKNITTDAGFKVDSGRVIATEIKDLSTFAVELQSGNGSSPNQEPGAGDPERDNPILGTDLAKTGDRAAVALLAFLVTAIIAGATCASAITIRRKNRE